jgi:hypothetical protein
LAISHLLAAIKVPHGKKIQMLRVKSSNVLTQKMSTKESNSWGYCNQMAGSVPIGVLVMEGVPCAMP